MWLLFVLTGWHPSSTSTAAILLQAVPDIAKDIVSNPALLTVSNLLLWERYNRLKKAIETLTSKTKDKEKGIEEL